jgi:dihydroorotate dehydrogenase (fumarate)
MPDLSTTYLGLQLKNPLVASASPLSKKVDVVRRLEEHGAAAVVMFSLFEEQIAAEMLELDYYLNRGEGTSAEALNYFPDLLSYNLGAKSYLDHLSALKKAVAIPVIGSLNGVSVGGWVEYARNIADAGADALELNIYYLPTDPNQSAADVEDRKVSLVAEIRSRVTIPIAVKLSPYFTSLPHIAQRFVEAGANGLVLFNRFYQPDLDIEALEVVPNLKLSTSAELRLPLRWIAILYGRLPVDFALTSGVHTAEDAVKAIMAGANVTMLASELLANGVERLGEVLTGLDRWLVDHEYTSVSQMKGSMSQRAVAEPAIFERAQYMKVLNSYNR